MKTRTGNIPMWQNKAPYKMYCDCSEVDELKAALEVLARKSRFSICPNKNGLCDKIGNIIDRREYKL